ncbi:helix-turn-helix domain-containing protein [Duganella flavida]|nr:helix-turn-helix transcriptional regulator [Duganella flavida]
MQESWAMNMPHPPIASPTFRERCARLLRSERERQNMSQEELAVLAGFHRSYVSHIERAVQNMSLENVEKLMVALGMLSKDSTLSALDRFATNLRRVRLESGLSQEKLAELAGVHRTYVSQAERRVVSISLDSIEKLAASLGVTEEELVGMSTPE